jgi:molybdenum cofactor cytidylyltransferase
MSTVGAPFAAVILAAGAGSRFDDTPGAKLRAELEGRTVLEHVLRAVRAFGPGAAIVVVGHGAEALERAIAWQGEIRVRNREPERGLASSLRVGFEALEMLPAAGTLEGAFVVLGDQPRLRAEVMHALAAAVPRAKAQALGVIAPSYVASPGPRNPVLLLPSAWGLVRQSRGDRGLGALIEARPDLVLEVAVAGDMPDVDTPDDLERLRLR